MLKGRKHHEGRHKRIRESRTERLLEGRKGGNNEAKTDHEAEILRKERITEGKRSKFI